MATGIGNLPYAMTPVSPFDTITAQETNERISNIESLASGTGIGDGAIVSSKLGLSKTVDANGWTVYDYGNWKEYKKRITSSATFAASQVYTLTLSSNNLPVGISTIGNNIVSAAALINAQAYALSWNFDGMTTSSTLLNISAQNRLGATQAYNMIFDITITTP